MDVTLLVVTSEELPKKITDCFQEEGYPCHYSRGRLKTKETLETKEIDVILWFNITEDMNQALAQDLIQVFNSYQKIPLVFIGVGTPSHEFVEQIAHYFAFVDLNDHPEELKKNIEQAYSHHRMNLNINTHRSESASREMDFKNLMHKSQQQQEQTEIQANQTLTPLTLMAPWNAVDSVEKKMLAQFDNDIQARQGFFQYFKRWFNL